MSKATTVQDFQLLSSFEEVRRTLLQEEFRERLDKPLAYWALPNDRRLPLAFLGRSLADLLETPFEDLAATPGIGQKKIHSLVRLLKRAVHDDLPTPASPEENGEAEVLPQAAVDESGQFDPDRVSELVFGHWRRTVRRHGLEAVKLGRVAPSLQRLPTVIWATPLRFYAERGVAEIRSLKTHGEKRVRAVLEVFHSIHELLGDLDAGAHLAFRLVPLFVPRVESWISRASTTREPLLADEVAAGLVRPLLEQVEIDAGETVLELAQGRLNIDRDKESVRSQAQRLGVTRARVYQLLDDCGRIMDVRWPEGRRRITELLEAARTRGDEKPVRGLIKDTFEMFFPDRSASEREDDE